MPSGLSENQRVLLSALAWNGGLAPYLTYFSFLSTCFHSLLLSPSLHCPLRGTPSPMPAGPLPHPSPGCQVQAHKGPDGALLAQPPLPAAPSWGGH